MRAPLSLRGPSAQKPLRDCRGGRGPPARPCWWLGGTSASAVPWHLGRELLGAAGSGLLAVFGSVRWGEGVPWGNDLQENLRVNETRSKGPDRVPSVRANWGRNLQIDGLE